MRHTIISGAIPALLALFMGTTALADNHAGDGDKPSISASRTATVSATVDAIDYDTREVTLVGPQGNSMTFIASDAVANLAQVEVGDVVTAEVTEEVTVEVFANPEGTQPGAGEFVAEASAEPGAKPGAAIMDTVVITAVVEGINLEDNTFTLRGPEGNVSEFVARNPDNLRKADVGDLVVITISQAVGVIVETPADE